MNILDRTDHFKSLGVTVGQLHYHIEKRNHLAVETVDSGGILNDQLFLGIIKEFQLRSAFKINSGHGKKFNLCFAFVENHKVTDSLRNILGSRKISHDTVIGLFEGFKINL